MKLGFDKLKLSDDAATRPCNPGGGSPSLYTVIQCSTGPLMTKRNRGQCNCCGTTSEKSTDYTAPISRRVERPNQKQPAKGLTVASSLKFNLTIQSQIAKFSLANQVVNCCAYRKLLKVTEKSND